MLSVVVLVLKVPTNNPEDAVLSARATVILPAPDDEVTKAWVDSDVVVLAFISESFTVTTTESPFKKASDLLREREPIPD